MTSGHPQCLHEHSENFPNQLATVSIPTSNVLMKTRVFKNIIIWICKNCNWRRYANLTLGRRNGTPATFLIYLTICAREFWKLSAVDQVHLKGFLTDMRE